MGLPNSISVKFGISIQKTLICCLETINLSDKLFKNKNLNLKLINWINLKGNKLEINWVFLYKTFVNRDS